MKENSQAMMSERTEDIVDLWEYFYLIRKNLLSVLSFAIVVSASAILVIFSLRPIYLGETTLLIEATDANVISIEEVYQLGTGKSEYYATQFEILKSRELASVVVERQNELFDLLLAYEKEKKFPLLDVLSPELPLTEEQSFKEKVNLFTDRVAIRPIRGTQLVKITVEFETPEGAAGLANELATVYIENNLEARLAMTQQAATWLAGRIDGLKLKLQESEENLQQYRETEDLVNLEGEKTLAAKELGEVSTKLSESRQRRLEAENIAIQIEKLSDRKSKNNIEALSTIPAVLQHSLVQRFKEQEGIAEQKLSELSKRYGYKHPKIIAAKSDLEAAKENTASQIFKVVEGVHKEYEVAKATEEALVKDVDRLKELVQKTTRKQYRLDELTREVTVNRQLYETFFSRIKETSEAGDLQTANARVVDLAVIPVEPIKPKRAMLSAMVIFLSLVGGVILVLVRDALDSTVKSRDDVIIKLRAQLLGVLPIIKDAKGQPTPALTFAKGGANTFSESIRTIRTGVVLSGLDNPHKILVVTSSIPGEGKTTLSSNLAVAFGQMGKTLLIDADMRRPSVATNFGIKLSAPGLSNLVAETAEPRTCIHRVEGMGIDIIPAGVVPPNPLELLSSKRFATVLASLEKHYDRIIIDSAPCEVVSDALILSTFASAVIYVVKADSTNFKAVKSGVARLRESNAALTGVVLNQVNVDKESAYGYGRYYGGYYDYYGYSSNTAEAPKGKS